MENLRIVDTHLHFAGPDMVNPWVDNILHAVSERRNDELSEASLLENIARDKVNVEKLVYVQCFNGTPLEEAMWALGMANNMTSKVESVVAEIPVPDGEAAVREFLSKLTSKSANGALPAKLRGGRVVLLGEPMPPIDACLDKNYIAGLKVLEENHLHWEWCCHHTALPNIAKVCAELKDMTFVLDHLGRNKGSENDLEDWKKNLALVAKNKNVVAKIGGIEEWGVKDPGPLLDHAIKCFGFERLLFESNWFVCRAFGYTYGELVKVAYDALVRNGAKDADLHLVFCRNGEKIYRFIC